MTVPTVREYADTWLAYHPRSHATEDTYKQRLNTALAIRPGSNRLGDLPMDVIERPLANGVLRALLDQGRSYQGIRNIIGTLSAMWNDALFEDNVVDMNPWKGIKLRANDPRIRKPPKVKQTWSPSDMDLFSVMAGPRYQPLVGLMARCGLRLGEVLGLEWQDIDTELGYVYVRGTVHNGRFYPGDSPRKRHVRRVPLPQAVATQLQKVPRLDTTDTVFPTPSGRLWHHRNFYRDVWNPIREEVGMDITPHAMRHSWETHMAAMGIDHADLADAAGHSLETMMRVYVHPTRRSDDAIREAAE